MTTGHVLAQQLEHVALDAVRLHPQNPRVGNVELIKESVDANGFFGALVVQRSTGHILVGNHRWKAAREAGLPTVPVLYVDVDDARALRILLADNKTADAGSYNTSVLADVLKALEGQPEGLLGTGYSAQEFDALLASLAPTDETNPERDGELLAKAGLALAPPRHTVGKGDRWRMGPHALVCASVFADWAQWAPLLAPHALFVPYPGPFVALSTAADARTLVLVQPDAYIAGHILDRYADVHGEAKVTCEVRA